MVTHRLRNERTGFVFWTHRFLRKMADIRPLSQVRNFLHLFYCYSVNLNAVSCLTEDVIHHRFLLQQDNLTKTEYRNIDLNRCWEVKADSNVFPFCIGRADIKHVFGWCTGLEVVN